MALSSPSGALEAFEFSNGSFSTLIRGVEGINSAGLDTEDDIDEGRGWKIDGS